MPGRAGKKKATVTAWPLQYPPDVREPTSAAWRLDQTPPAPANLRCWKHSRQNTGRPCVGRNGTVVSFPHAEQLVVVSTRSLEADAPGAGREARLALQLLHRLGSFLKFLSAKKSCSPAVQMNSVPQSTHVRDLSWNSIGSTLSPTRGRPVTNNPVRQRPARTRSLFLIRYEAGRAISQQLVRLAALLFARTLSRQGLLGTTTIARLQVERMFLDIFDDIFLLYLPLKASQGAFDRFTFLNLDFSQY
jgi:hypothetical protein